MVRVARAGQEMAQVIPRLVTVGNGIYECDHCGYWSPFLGDVEIHVCRVTTGEEQDSSWYGTDEN